MGDQVDVIVPTFGDRTYWDPLADRALRSAYAQMVQPRAVHRMHARTLADARNEGASRAKGEWLIFLDADDELDVHYIEAMLHGRGDIRQPSTLGVTNGVEDDFPVLIPPKPSFLQGNHLVIGSMMRRSCFEQAGGFADLAILEDWELFIRMRLCGAEVGAAPDAIYRVNVRTKSRNQMPDHGWVYNHIRERYQQEWAARGLL